jgi:hypothetical protein
LSLKRCCQTRRLYPSLLQIAATAHIAVGFTERRPPTIRTASQLLRAVPASCEVLLLRAVADVLLGETEAAVACVKEARRWGAMQHSSSWRAAQRQQQLGSSR